MKILLTGGAGYVGSACLRWLLEHGHDPIAYDNLSEGNRAAVPDAPDAADRGRHRRRRTRLARAMRDHGVEAVMHFAALLSVPESIVKPEEYYDVNVVGTKSVLDAMLQRRRPPDPLQQHGGDLWIPQRDAAARGLAPGSPRRRTARPSWPASG